MQQDAQKKDFTGLFDQWASEYDQTVYDAHGEYQEVFEKYDDILNKVAEYIPAEARVVLEIGVGTGNLAQLILAQGYEVKGVEPSGEMRKQVHRKSLDIDLRKGDFLNLPFAAEEKVDAIVSSFAFHHLPFEDKKIAIRRMKHLLQPGGKIIFADTAYENQQSKQAILERVEQQGYSNLLHDLQTEYYEQIDDLKHIFEQEGFAIQVEQLNRFVWLMVCQQER